MNARLRIRLATSFLACSIAIAPAAQAQTYGFNQAPERLELVQLAAAVLSIPATIAAQEYQDSNLLAFAESGLKATYELLAIYHQTGGKLPAIEVKSLSYNQPWFVWDTVQAVKALLATFTTQPETISNQALTGNNRQLTPQAKRAIGIVLASVEGSMRIWSTLINEQPASDEQSRLVRSKQELLNCIGSWARLANMYLHSKDKGHQALLIALTLANLVLIPVQGYAFKQSSEAFVIEEAKRKEIADKTAAEEKKKAEDKAKEDANKKPKKDDKKPKDDPKQPKDDPRNPNTLPNPPAVVPNNTQPADLDAFDALGDDINANNNANNKVDNNAQQNNQYALIRNNLGRRKKQNNLTDLDALDLVMNDNNDKDKDKDKKQAKPDKKQDVKKAALECPICQDKLGDDPKLIQFTQCAHGFHRACLRQWIDMQPQNTFRKDHGNKQVTCPTCQTVIVEKAEVVDDGKVTDDEQRMVAEALGQGDNNPRRQIDPDVQPIIYPSDDEADLDPDTRRAIEESKRDQ